MIHDFSWADDRRYRQAAAKTFTENDDVGLYFEMFVSVTSSASSQPDFHLIRNKEDPMVAAEGFNLFEVARWGNDHSPVRLDRLDEQRGDFSGRQRPRKQMFKVINGLRLRLAAISIRVRIGKKREAWGFCCALLRRMSRNRHRACSSTVIGANK